MFFVDVDLLLLNREQEHLYRKVIFVFHEENKKFSNIQTSKKQGGEDLNMEKDIDKIQKNADTEIVIRVDDFGGKRGVTIREFVRGERYTGFTKAGTRIPVEHFGKFKEAINSISEDDLMADLPVQEGQSSEGQSSLSGSKSPGQGDSDSSGASSGDDIQEEAM